MLNNQTQNQETKTKTSLQMQRIKDGKFTQPTLQNNLNIHHFCVNKI